jgi:hypothetical protein
VGEEAAPFVTLLASYTSLTHQIRYPKQLTSRLTLSNDVLSLNGVLSLLDAFTFRS